MVPPAVPQQSARSVPRHDLASADNVVEKCGDFRNCEGFRMTAARDDAACTGAVLRKPPVKETALGERVRCRGL